MADSYFDLIIPAAGIGARMKKSIPKPFLQLKGKDVLEQSLWSFSSQPIRKLIIATSAENNDRIKAYDFFTANQSIELILCEGGKERHESVLNALNHVTSDFVAVHDAVRPFSSAQLIERLFEKAQKKGSAIPALKSRDTIKIVNQDAITSTLNRNELVLAQTPQFFMTSIYRAALNQIRDDIKYTDDASIVEAAGFNVYWVEGEDHNLKLTYPEDLMYADWLLSEGKV